MAQVPTQMIHRDPQLFYWILIPITVVMILTGVLRHYATILTANSPKKQDLLSIREQQSLIRGINLRINGNSISPTSFRDRQNNLVGAFKSGAFLKDPDKKGQGAPNPMTDPAAMEGMMGMMKGNIAMIVPQTLIMGWINTFFSGFVIIRLPFPLTIKFKSMLQAGVATREMDPQWMSSISWYVLCIFGLQPVINYLAGSDEAAGQISQQLGQMSPAAGAQMFGPGVDADKQFQSEAENLAVVVHHHIMEGVEDRLLQALKMQSQKQRIDDSLNALGSMSLNDADELSSYNRSSPNTVAYQDSLANAYGVSLNQQILAFKPAPPESSKPVDLRSQYSRPIKNASIASTQFKRRVATAPERVLDAPGLLDDYYLNLLDQSSGNQVAIGLERNIYIWSSPIKSHKIL